MIISVIHEFLGKNEKLPHYLNGLYESSVKNLNRNQRKKLKSLLVSIQMCLRNHSLILAEL